MDKPIVFLSHSSKDRRELMLLKRLLDKKCVGAITFFLSSDDESIRPGTLWPEEIRNALDKASLMFVFISPAAIKSGWTYFETGYAFCRIRHVTPFCLPGIDKGSLPAPLNLLQARNLHSAKDLAVLIQECNHEFGTSVPDSFGKHEFDEMFARHAEWEIESPTNWTKALNRLTVFAEGGKGAERPFARLCKSRGLDCDTSGIEEYNHQVVASGVNLTVDHHYRDEDEKNAEPVYDYVFKVAPELTEEVFPILDAWAKKARVSPTFQVKVVFSEDVLFEHEPHQLTRKIYRSEISMLSDGNYRFGKVEFKLKEEKVNSYSDDSEVVLRSTCASGMAGFPLSRLILNLLKLGVISVAKPSRRKAR